MYRFSTAANGKPKAKAQLLGSGTILNEARAAAGLLEKYGVAADVWSVTSYNELYREAHGCDRWNMLNPGEQAKVPYVTQALQDTQGVIVAASDYLKVLPASIDRWMPRRVRALGTDGFGRSEARKELREFFEVESRYIALATLAELAQNGEIEPKVVTRAIKDFGIDPNKKNPAKD
jgi:pyruvate dehydrogenase E1 component